VGRLCIVSVVVSADDEEDVTVPRYVGLRPIVGAGSLLNKRK